MEQIDEVTKSSPVQVAMSSTDEVEHNIEHHLKIKEVSPETIVSEKAVPIQRKPTKTCVLL